MNYYSQLKASIEQLCQWPFLLDENFSTNQDRINDKLYYFINLLKMPPRQRSEENDISWIWQLFNEMLQQ